MEEINHNINGVEVILHCYFDKGEPQNDMLWEQGTAPSLDINHIMINKTDIYQILLDIDGGCDYIRDLEEKLLEEKLDSLKDY